MTEPTLKPGGQSGDQTPNDDNTVTVTGYQDKGDTGVSNPPNDPIETSQPTPQTQAPQAPQVTPQQAQPAPPGSMQEPAPVKPQMPQAPKGVSPEDPNADNPLVQRASVFRTAMDAILPPSFTTTVDPNTGVATRTQVPRTKTEFGMALALEAISGGLAGLSAQGPSNEGKAGLLGLQQGQAIAAKQQQLQEQQAKQATENFTQQAQEKTRQAGVLETNMRTYANAQTIGRKDFDQNQALVAPSKEGLDRIEKQIPGAIVAHITEAQFKDYHVTKDNAIPEAVVPRIGPDGKQAVNAYGVPQWDISYAIIDPHLKLENIMTPDERAIMVKHKRPGFVNGDGDEVKWPADAKMTATKWLNYKAQAAGLMLAETELKDYNETMKQGDPAGNYEFSGGGNVNVPNDAGQSDQINEAAAKYHVPAAVLRSVAMQESGGHHIDPKTGKIAASGTGPTGIMQIAKSTAKDYKGDPSDQTQNIDMSAHYLSDLIDQNKGDLTAALQIYGGQTPGYAAKVLGRAGMASATGTPTSGQFKDLDMQAAEDKDPTFTDAFTKFQNYISSNGYNKNGTSDYTGAMKAYQMDDSAGANKVLNFFGGMGQLAKFDQQNAFNLKQQQNDEALEQAGKLAKQKQDVADAGSAKMRENLAIPDNFTIPQNAMDMTSQELRANLKAQGVKIPANFESLYQVAHFHDALGGAYPGRVWLKGSPDEMDHQTASSYIGQFINPNFDQGTYASNVNLRKKLYDPSVKNAGNTIYTASVAAGHISQLSDLADAMDAANSGSDFRPLNKLANSFHVAIGDTPANTYKAVATAVANEIAKNVAGDKPSEDTIHDFLQTLDPSSARAQIEGVSRALTGLMHERISDLDEQSQSSLHEHLHNVGSHATSLFQKYGMDTPWAVQTGTGPTNAAGPLGSQGNPALPRGHGERIPDDVLKQYWTAYHGDSNAIHKAVTDAGYK